MARIARAGIPECFTESETQALDSTDIESHYRRRYRRPVKSPDVDPDHLPIDLSADPAEAREPIVQVPVGDDGRYVLGKDEDAREGFRSKKHGFTSNVFLGWDLHLSCDVPDVGNESVPAFIRGAGLAPAGSHKGAAGIRIVDSIRALGSPLKVILNDRGYSYVKVENWAEPLAQRHLQQVFDLHSNQLGCRPGPIVGTLAIDGNLFCDAVPEDLRTLPSYSRNMTQKDRADLAARYDARARYAFEPFGRANQTTGSQRFRGPALTGKVRCPNHAPSVSLSRGASRPLTICEPGRPCACARTVTLTARDYLRAHQRPLFGTSKWLSSYGRRQAVESVNAELKRNRFGSIRGGIRVKGTVKHQLLLAFVLGALNMAMASDWAGRDWLDLCSLSTRPARLRRRRETKTAFHRVAEISREGPT